MPSEPKSSSGLSEASRYWDQVLDPQNLEREASTLPLEDEIAFADTPDFAQARRFLSQTGDSPAAPRWTVDLGAGLGASAFLLARAGCPVIAIDSSISRMRALRKRAEEAGVADRVTAIVALAESLPFAAGSIPALYTRAVLIHVDLDCGSKEIGRVLRPHGRAALLEPTTGNPLVNLYRRFLAPKAWQSITHYFDRAAQKQVAEGAYAGGKWSVKPFYLFAFLAFVFQFGWPKPRLFRFFLRPLVFIDKILFMIPPLRRLAWFGVIELEKSSQKIDANSRKLKSEN